MSFDFPNSPTNGQVFAPTGGPVYVYTGGVWRMQGSGQVVTAEARNRVVNPAMQISQENPKNVSLSANAAYFADQWPLIFSGDGTVTFATVSNSYIGADAGPYCGTILVGTADAAMAAAQYLMAFQLLEGIRIADFNWGTANAQPVVLRFKATSSIATTFAVAIRNGLANDRSFVKNCTLAANTPTWFTIPIPGDVTGTWAIDNSSALRVSITLAAGSSYHAPAEGVWSAGAFVTTAATSNFWATAGARFSFGAVGLYLDPNATGVPPPWQMPDEAEELRACQRYYEKSVVGASATKTVSGYGAAGSGIFGSFTPAAGTMRATPTISFANATTANVNGAAMPVQSSSTTGYRTMIVVTATGTAYCNFEQVLSARM